MFKPLQMHRLLFSKCNIDIAIHKGHLEYNTEQYPEPCSPFPLTIMDLCLKITPWISAFPPNPESAENTE